MPRQPHLPVLLAIACALFLRALVPVGWMPASTGAAFAIEPCPAAQSIPVLHEPLDHRGTHADHRSRHGGQHDGDCNFSPLLAGYASAAVPNQLPALVAAVAQRAAPIAAPAFKTGPPAPPPPATGPPFVA